jgi:hypothetical protein
MKKTKKLYKVGIWGQFGSGGQIADGQAVRTTIITQEIIERYGKDKIRILNTNNWSRHPILFFLKCISLVSKCKNIIIFPANNGFKVFVPILNYINLLFKHELYYVVIGGFLPSLLKNNPKYLRFLKKYRALFVQTKNLKNELAELGLKNIYILSNLKKLQKLEEDDIKVNTDKQVSV